MYTARMDPRLNRYLDATARLAQWPAGRADQGLVLDYLAGKIPPAQNFNEPQINEFLKAWHTFGDWSLLRRELVDSSRIRRTPDGTKYWRPQPHTDAYLAGAVILLRRHVLAVRLVGTSRFTAPGGPLHAGEAAAAALVRLVGSDLNITVTEADFVHLGEYLERSPSQANETDHWQAFVLDHWEGDMHHAGHIEELRWLTSDLPPDIDIEPVLRDEIIPLLHERQLID